MIDSQDWKNHDRIDFKNQNLELIRLPDFEIQSPGLSFNTELHFDNCNIEAMSASTLFLGKKIVLNNCIINQELGFMATYFFGGFEMRNCVVKGFSTFSCGVHNNPPNKFIIDSCIFENYVDFFDVFFGWEAIITNNKFLKGTNLGVYLKVPFGIEKGIEFKLEKNEGNVNLRTEE